MPHIEEICYRFILHEGEIFVQKTGKEFKYKIKGNILKPISINRNLSKAEFEKALPLLPLENTVPVQHLQGPAFIYAILMDERISQGDW